jgi:hypothetical protein
MQSRVPRYSYPKQKTKRHNDDTASRTRSKTGYLNQNVGDRTRSKLQAIYYSCGQEVYFALYNVVRAKGHANFKILDL